MIKRAKRELARRELARRSFTHFLALANGPYWTPTRFSSFLSQSVQDFLDAKTGNAYDILIIQAPPQHGKSWTITESLPAWALMRNPALRVIMASYNDKSAEKFALRNREKLDAWGGILFGAELDLKRSTYFTLRGERGYLLSAGILGGVTGYSADLLIIDDPVKNRKEADSETIRDNIWDEWFSSLRTRVQPGGKIIVIHTPWHEDDLSARVIGTEDRVTVLRFPVEAEPTEAEPDPLGRQRGEPLCPEIGRDRTWVEQTKTVCLRDPKAGQRDWLALYMCRPVAQGGNIIKRDWWRFYDAPPSAFGTQCVSVDCAFKDGENNDYVAVTVWGKRDEEYYLLDCRNLHLDFVGTLRAVRDAAAKLPRASPVLIEDKANGPAVISILQRELFCIPVDPRGGKLARVNAVSPAIQSGHVLIPRRAPWREEFLDQFTSFPAGKHDDMVDSASQALTYLFDASGVWQPPTEEEERRAREWNAARRAVTGGDLYDFYG